MGAEMLKEFEDLREKNVMAIKTPRRMAGKLPGCTACIRPKK